MRQTLPAQGVARNVMQSVFEKTDATHCEGFD